MWLLLEGYRPREKNCYESNHRTRKEIRFFFHGLIFNYIDPNNYNPRPPLMLSGQLLKVFPNIPVGPNRNVLFHLISNRISWSLGGTECAHHFSHTSINIVQNSAWKYNSYFIFIFYLWKTQFVRTDNLLTTFDLTMSEFNFNLISTA